MVILVREAVRRLRDNDAGLVELHFDSVSRPTRLSDAEIIELAGALALNPTLTKLDLFGIGDRTSLGQGTGRAIGQALALNTTLTRLGLSGDSLREGGVRAIGKALALNTTLTQLDISLFGIGLGKGTFWHWPGGVRTIGEALTLNTTLTQHQ